MHRVACGICGESLELEAPGTLSSVGWKVVRVQVVVACALRQAVVPVQKGVRLVHGFQTMVRLVGLGLEQAGKKEKCVSETVWWGTFGLMTLL